MTDPTDLRARPGIRKSRCDLRAIDELDALDAEIAETESMATPPNVVDVKDELNASALPVFREMVRFTIRERGQSFRGLAKLAGCTHVAFIDAYRGRRRGSWYMAEAVRRIPGTQLVEARIRSTLARREVVRAAS